MTTLQKINFPHRHNADGSHDSICAVCYVTVASAYEESELATSEKAHRCDLEILFQYRDFVPQRIHLLAKKASAA